MKGYTTAGVFLCGLFFDLQVNAGILAI